MSDCGGPKAAKKTPAGCPLQRASTALRAGAHGGAAGKRQRKGGDGHQAEIHLVRSLWLSFSNIGCPGGATGCRPGIFPSASSAKPIERKSPQQLICAPLRINFQALPKGPSRAGGWPLNPAYAAAKQRSFDRPQKRIALFSRAIAPPIPLFSVPLPIFEICALWKGECCSIEAPLVTECSAAW